MYIIRHIDNQYVSRGLMIMLLLVYGCLETPAQLSFANCSLLAKTESCVDKLDDASDTVQLGKRYAITTRASQDGVIRRTTLS